MRSRWIPLALLLAGCGNSQPQPVAIESWDMCSQCRMAISQKRYAAEFIDQNGGVFKFDDLLCMARYLRNREENVTVVAYFVTDSESLQWLKGEDARYVRSPSFKTPMSGGVVAFNRNSRVEEIASEKKGTLLSFNDVLHLEE